MSRTAQQPDARRAALKAAITRVLKHRRGPRAAITMTQLHALVTGELLIPMKRYDQTRITRSIVAELRQEGSPIGNARGGYFWAEHAGQLDATAQQFHSRAMAALRQEKALRRISAQALGEQIALELADGQLDTPPSTQHDTPAPEATP